MQAPSSQKVDEDIYRTIFIDHWDSFTEEEKLEALEKAREYLLSATKERAHYRHRIAVSKQSYFATMKGRKQQSKPDATHYSWDFAQQGRYPYEDHQVGPVYFKTPGTAQLFGNCRASLDC